MIVVDTAHGHTKKVSEIIKFIKKKKKKKTALCAGNIAQKNGFLFQTLGLGKGGEGFLQRFDNRRTRHPRNIRRSGKSETEGWHDQKGQVALRVFGERNVSGGRQKLQVEPEEDHEQGSCPEVGHRKPAEGHYREHMIKPTVLLEPG